MSDTILVLLWWKHGIRAPKLLHGPRIQTFARWPRADGLRRTQLACDDLERVSLSQSFTSKRDGVNENRVPKGAR